MKELFTHLQRSMQAGEDAVLVSILADSGSAPRGLGAHMLVNARGRVCGTIGGGAVEHHAEQLAREALQEGRSLVKDYHLSRDLGMICGGNVTVLYQFIAASDAAMKALTAAALELFAADADMWLVTLLTPGADWRMGVAGRDTLSVGLGLSLEDLKPWLKSAPASFVRDDYTCYVEPLNSAGRVLVFGGGHVAQALAPVLAKLNFNCHVMDNRPELCDESLFPGVKRVICGDYEHIGHDVQIHADDYVVVMTHGHVADYVVQKQAMQANPAYIGVIGSRNKVKTIAAKLAADGFTAEEISRVHTPIGIAIKAETPDEIAISIAAELIRVRAERMGR